MASRALSQACRADSGLGFPLPLLSSNPLSMSVSPVRVHCVSLRDILSPFAILSIGKGRLVPNYFQRVENASVASASANFHLQRDTSSLMILVMAIDVKTLIDLSGGPEEIAKASRKTPEKVSTWAVKKWMQRGIPDAHWGLISALSGESIEAIYKANRSFRSATRAA